MKPIVKKLFVNVKSKNVFANVAGGVHFGSMTLSAAENIPTKFLLAAFATGAVAGKIKPAAEGDIPFGVMTDEAIAGEPVNVQFLNGIGSVNMVAESVIERGSLLCLGENGRVKALPNTPGIYTQVGISLSSAAIAGAILEVLPCFPQIITIA